MGSDINVEQELLNLGVEPTDEKVSQYLLMRNSGMDISKDSINRPYVEVYREIFPKPKAIDERGYLVRDKDKPGQAQSPVFGQGTRSTAELKMEMPSDTSGKKSITGRVTDKIVDILPGSDEIRKQQVTPPEQRRGVAGTIASTLPNVHTTPAQSSYENPIWSVLRFLNIPSSMLGALGETITEQVGVGTIPEDLKDSSFGERAAANYARQSAKLEGAAELGEKVGRVGQAAMGFKPDAGIYAPGSRKLVQSLGMDPEKINRIGLDDVGYLFGLGVDILIPSPIEAVGPVKKGISELSNLIKPLSKVPESKALPDGARLLENIEFHTKRELSKGMATQDVKPGFVADKAVLVGAGQKVTPELFEHGNLVVQSDMPLEDGKDFIGLVYQLDNGLAKPTSIVSRIDNPDTIKEIERLAVESSKARQPADNYLYNIIGGRPRTTDHPAFSAKNQVMRYDDAFTKYHDLQKAIDRTTKRMWEENGNVKPTAGPEADLFRRYEEISKTINNLIQNRTTTKFSVDELPDTIKVMNELDSKIREVEKLHPGVLGDWKSVYDNVVDIDKIEFDGFGLYTKATKDYLNNNLGAADKEFRDVEVPLDKRLREAGDLTSKFSKPTTDESLLKLQDSALRSNSEYKRRLAIKRLGAAMDEVADSRGLGAGKPTPTDIDSPSAQMISHLEKEYESLVSSIPTRFKYWARKGEQGIEDMFKELVDDGLSKEEVIKAFGKALKSDLAKMDLRITSKSGDSSGTAPPEAIERIENFINLATKFIGSSESSDITRKDFENIYETILKVISSGIDIRGKSFYMSSGNASTLEEAAKSLAGAFNSERFHKTLAKAYYFAGSELAAKKTTDKLIEYGFASLEALAKHKPTIDALESRGYVVSDVIDIARSTLSNKPGMGLQDMIDELHRLPGAKPYEEIYQDIVETFPIGGILSAMGRDIDELLVNRELEHNIFTRADILKRLVASSPEMMSVWGKLPEAIRERRAQTLIERITEMDKRDMSPILRFIADITSRHPTFLKNAILNGSLIPNLRFTAANLTNPLIVYQQLGLKSLVGMMANLPESLKVLSNINSRRVVAAAPLFKVNGKLYTVGDIAKIATTNDIIGGQTAFELTGEVLEDMRNYLPRDFNIWQKIGEQIGIKSSMSWYGAFNSSVDDMYRVGVMIDSLKRGESEALAIKKAKEALFNYSDLHPTERKWIAHNFFFYSFMRHNFVSTAKALVSGKGSTRIKNILNTVHDNLDYNESTNEWADTRIPLGKVKATDMYKMYGPSVPAAEAMKQLVDIFDLAYWTITRDPGEQSEIALDFMSKQAVNPYMEAFVLAVTKGEIDLRRRGDTADRPDERIVEFWRLTGMLDDDGGGIAAQLFSLVPDTKRRYTDDVLDPKKSNAFKFGNDIGKRNYGLYQSILWDTVVGQGRTTRDYMRFFDPRNSNNTLVRMLDFTGLGSPYRMKTLSETQADSSSSINRDYKEK